MVAGPGLTGNGTVASPLTLTTLSSSASNTGVYAAGPRPTGLWTWLSYNPVLLPGGAGAWDSAGVVCNSVLKVGNTYRMYYTGTTGSIFPGVGIATSTDGINWAKYSGNPILSLGSAGAWDSDSINRASVVFDGTTYYLFYWGQGGGSQMIGLATSTDGFNFAKSASNPVLSPTSGWESTYVGYPDVIYENGTFTMWYGGNDGSNNGLTWRVGRATSTTGTTWTRDSLNPVVSLQYSYERTSITNTQVIKVGRMYYMIYSANDGTNLRAALATSWDGRVWTKAPSNPVLDVIPGTFMSKWLGKPGLLVEGDRIWGWFSGNNTTWSIGAAAIDLQ